MTITERTAPEIRQIPVRDFDASVLSPDARFPGTEGFEVAVITHFASHYAEKGWNAAVTVDDERGGPRPLTAKLPEGQLPLYPGP